MALEPGSFVGSGAIHRPLGELVPQRDRARPLAEILIQGALSGERDAGEHAVGMLLTRQTAIGAGIETAERGQELAVGMLDPAEQPHPVPDHRPRIGRHPEQDDQNGLGERAGAADQGRNRSAQTGRGEQDRDHHVLHAPCEGGGPIQAWAQLGGAPGRAVSPSWRRAETRPEQAFRWFRSVAR